ncbi:MAG: 2-hydroxyacid dehydrogenase [Nitrospinales bacterium]
MKPIVCVTNTFPEAGLAVLHPHCELRANRSGKRPTPEDLVEMVSASDGIITYLSDKIDANIIDRGRHLKVIANYAAGYNNIDIAYAGQKGVWVTNTPGVLHETTADLAWALILASARQIVPADRFTRQGRFDGWAAKLFLGRDVHGKTLGIVGCGEIGKAVARRARGFHMRVLYYQRTPLSKDEESALQAVYTPFEELITNADFITLHLPLNRDSEYLIGRGELAMMKNTAFLINTARGKVVDDRALVEALRTGKIAGAALDVYENEPALTEGMMELDNLVLLPHIGSASVETRDRMAALAAENVLDVLSGKKPRSAVNSVKR